MEGGNSGDISWLSSKVLLQQAPFILDTTVHGDFQRRGIGTELVRLAAEQAKAAGCEWLHVDYEPELEPFYAQAGFKPTAARPDPPEKYLGHRQGGGWFRGESIRSSCVEKACRHSRFDKLTANGK